MMYKLMLRDTLRAMRFEHVENRIPDHSSIGFDVNLVSIPLELKVIKPPYLVASSSDVVTRVYCEGEYWELVDNFGEPSQVVVDPSLIVPVSILERRREACMSYLLGHGNTTQIGYKQLGEPTKQELWNQLQQIDVKLFNAGMDDLFRKPSLMGFEFRIGRSV